MGRKWLSNYFMEPFHTSYEALHLDGRSYLEQGYHLFH